MLLTAYGALIPARCFSWQDNISEMLSQELHELRWRESHKHYNFFLFYSSVSVPWS